MLFLPVCHPNLPILIKEEMENVQRAPKQLLLKFQATLMLHLTTETLYYKHFNLDQSLFLLLPDLFGGNSILVVFILDVVSMLILITVSKLLAMIWVTLAILIGLLETVGLNHGVKKAICIWKCTQINHPVVLIVEPIQPLLMELDVLEAHHQSQFVDNVESYMTTLTQLFEN